MFRTRPRLPAGRQVAHLGRRELARDAENYTAILPSSIVISRTRPRSSAG